MVLCFCIVYSGTDLPPRADGGRTICFASLCGGLASFPSFFVSIMSKNSFPKPFVLNAIRSRTLLRDVSPYWFPLSPRREPTLPRRLDDAPRGEPCLGIKQFNLTLLLWYHAVRLPCEVSVNLLHELRRRADKGVLVAHIFHGLLPPPLRLALPALGCFHLDAQPVVVPAWNEQQQV